MYVQLSVCNHVEAAETNSLLLLVIAGIGFFPEISEKLDLLNKHSCVSTYDWLTLWPSMINTVCGHDWQMRKVCCPAGRTIFSLQLLAASASCPFATLLSMSRAAFDWLTQATCIMLNPLRWLSHDLNCLDCTGFRSGLLSVVTTETLVSNNGHFNTCKYASPPPLPLPLFFFNSAYSAGRFSWGACWWQRQGA